MVCELLIGRTSKAAGPRKLSFGQLDPLALLRFSIEEFDLEIRVTPL
jgi:hypothetical protein